MAALSGRVEEVGRRLRGQVWGEGLLSIAAVGVIWAMVTLGLDGALGLPRWGRVMLLVAGLGAVGWVAWWRLWRPLGSLPRRDALALYVERRRPALRSRLISVVQLGRERAGSPEAEEFIRRLAEEVGREAAGMDPGEVVDGAGLRRAARWAVPLLALGLGWFVVALPTSWVLLRRAWLEELARPQRTRIVEVSGSRTVGRGDDFRVEARVTGVVPKSGRLWVRLGSGRIQEWPLDAEAPGEGVFARVLGGVTSSFRYRVRVNDAESEEFAVTVLPRPVLTNLVLTQILPRYTGILSRRVEPGALALLRGSRLRIEGEASQPLAEARVRQVGVERSIELGVDGDRPTRVLGEMVVEDPGLTGFSVELKDREGITSRDSAVYAVEVVEDQVPQVRVLVPSRREELVTPRGTVLVAFEARDDFGFGALRLRHQGVGETNGEPALIEMDMTGETNVVARRRFEWRLGSLQPALVEGGLREFWVEAVDRDDVGGPHTGRSERYLLRVVTEAEKRADLLGRAGDAIGRLGDVAQGQERLNDSLGRIIVEKASPP